MASRVHWWWVSPRRPEFRPMSPASLPTAATRVAARAAAASLILAAFGCTISVGGVAIPIPDPTVDLPIPAPPSSGAGSSRVLARADD
ncbi:MAG: hypothetical protein ACYC4J_12210 [Gemmatimonadaceae bacterium]